MGRNMDGIKAEDGLVHFAQQLFHPLRLSVSCLTVVMHSILEQSLLESTESSLCSFPKSTQSSAEKEKSPLLQWSCSAFSMLPNPEFVFLIVVSTPTLLSRAFNHLVFRADATVFSCALVQLERIWTICKEMSCNPCNALWHRCLLSCVHKHTVVQWLDYIYSLAIDVATSVFPLRLRTLQEVLPVLLHLNE